MVRQACFVYRAPLKIQSSPKCKAREKFRSAALMIGRSRASMRFAALAHPCAAYVSKKFFPRPPRMAEVRKMQEQFSTNASVGMKSGFLEVPYIEGGTTSGLQLPRSGQIRDIPMHYTQPLNRL